VNVNLKLNADNGLSSLQYNLNKVSNVFDTLLREYSLSENGKLVFDTEKEIIVDEPFIVSIKSEPYTDQVEIVLFFQVVIDI
jgi:hypothetical protein